MLHKKRITFTVIRFFCAAQAASNSLISNTTVAVMGESRRGPPVEEISSAAFSTEASELRSAESRRLRLRKTELWQYCHKFIY